MLKSVRVIMTNEEKLRQTFPRTIFVLEKEADKVKGIVVSDEWMNAEYEQSDAKDYRDCKRCPYSKNGMFAGTEECHECMWDSKLPTLGVDELKRLKEEIQQLQTYVLFKGDTKKVELSDVLELIDLYIKGE